MPPFRRWILFGLIGLALVIIGEIAREVFGPPVVRRTTVELSGMPAGAAPIRLVLVSDFHVIGPQMPPSRLAGIVARINAENPDIVLLAGDFAAWQYPASRFYTSAEAIAPLARLRARTGIFAVLGNHDHGEDTEPGDILPGDALARIGIPLLENRAVRAGGLTIAGTDGEAPGFTHPGLRATLTEQMRDLGPPFVGFAHKPRDTLNLPEGIHLVLAGHTHCGQIRLPLLNLPYADGVPDRMHCGRVDENGRTLIVTAGLGESDLPLRFFAPPDFWVITLVPRRDGLSIGRVPRYPDPIYGFN